jgi:hypothetical protein
MEEVIAEKMDEAGVQVPEKPLPSYPRDKKSGPSHSGHFTF